MMPDESPSRFPSVAPIPINGWRAMDQSLDTLSDHELLQLYIESGMRDALTAIVERYAAMIAGVTRRNLADAQDAEDAFQATFVVLIRSSKRIRKPKSLAAWLYGVAHRISQALRAKRRKENSRVATASSVGIKDMAVVALEDDMDPLTRIAQQMHLVAMDDEISRLPTNLREPVIEHYLRGASVPEIANDLELSITAVEGRLKRARRILRAKLAMRGMSLSSVTIACSQFQEQVNAQLAQPWSERLLHGAGGGTAGDHFDFPDLNSTPLLQELIQGELAMKLFPNIGILTATGVMCASLIGYSCFRSFNSHLLADNAHPSNVYVVSDQGEQNDEQSVAKPTIVTQSDNVTDPFGSPEAATASEVLTSEAESRIRKSFDQMGEAEFHQLPLREVLKHFSDTFDIPVYLDEKSLNELNIPEDAPVTLSLPRTNFRNALHFVLEPLELTYNIRHDVLVVSSKHVNSSVRFYDLPRQQNETTNRMAVVQLIESMVAPDEWQASGGTCNMCMYSDKLVVRASEPVHHEVGEFLRELAKQNSAAKK